MNRRAGVVLALVAVACGDDAVVGGDSGTPDAMFIDAGIVLAPAPPAPPAAPAPPAWSCPAGWRTVAGEPPTCDPWPESGVATCAAGEAHFPGEPGCRRVGAACPAGDWADPPPSGTVLYVRAGAPPGGDGTAAAPFALISAAAAASAAGTTILVAKGTYGEPVALPGGVTLRGACAAETRLILAAAGPGAVVRVVMPGAAIQDLTIGGPAVGVLAVNGGGVDLSGVVVEGAERSGIRAGVAGEVTGQDVVVRDTQLAADGATGRAIDVMDGGRIELTRAVLSGYPEGGAYAFDPGSEIRLADAAILDGRGDAAGLYGEGAVAWTGAAVVLDRVVIERHRLSGVRAYGAAATVTANDLVIRDALGQAADGSFGDGISVSEGGTVTVARGLIERVRLAGVNIEGSGRVEVTDAILRDLAADVAYEVGGAGAWVTGGSLALTRVHVTAATSAGILAGEATAEVTATDLVVEGTRTVQTLGVGIFASGGASVTSERVVLRDCIGAGILAGSGATVEVSDLVVEDTLPRPQVGNGFAVAVTAAQLTVRRATVARAPTMGISAATGASLVLEDVAVLDVGGAGPSSFGVVLTEAATGTATRLLVAGGAELGIAVMIGASLTATDVHVRDLSRAELTEGRAIDVESAGVATFTRLRVEGGGDVAVMAHGAGTEISLESAAVVGVEGAACAQSTCPNLGGGIALGAYEGGHVAARTFALTDGALCGVQISRDGAVDLRDGVVSGFPIGVNVQVDGYDYTRLQQGVEFTDNDRNLDAAELPLPDPAPPAPML